MRLFFIYILLFLTQLGFAQGHLFSTVKLSKKSVYIGEPLEVSVSVYTDTWFTKGVDIGNIKVNGAYSFYFRSVSKSERINGTNYSGVEFIYNVIPFSNNDIVFPSITVQVETPDKDDYKGKARTIKTKERTIKVRPVPRGLDQEQWLVTNSLSLHSNWLSDIKNMKVGGVIERKITRNIEGSVAELIPAVKWDTIANVSMYPSSPSLKNNKSKTSISASRTDGIRYLFEKEGEVIIPKMEFTYWNPYHNKLYKSTLKEVKINVLPNPNLGMLETLKDSLNKDLIVANETPVQEDKFEFLGLNLKQLIYYSAALIILLYILYRFLKWLFVSKMIVVKIRNRRKEYLKSEKHIFNKLLLALIFSSEQKQTILLYRWVDALKLEEPSLQYLIHKYDKEKIVGDKKIGVNNIVKLRRNYFSKKDRLNKKTNWINP